MLPFSNEAITGVMSCDRPQMRKTSRELVTAPSCSDCHEQAKSDCPARLGLLRTNAI